MGSCNPLNRNHVINKRTYNAKVLSEMSQVEDVFGDEDCAELSSKIAFEKIYTDGFRTQKIISEEKCLQEGFDNGFQSGLCVGRMLGIVFCNFRSTVNKLGDSGRLLSGLDHMFLVTLPLLIAKQDIMRDELFIEIRNNLLTYVHSIPNCDELVGVIDKYFPADSSRQVE